jgi:hypothetical protein
VARCSGAELQLDEASIAWTIGRLRNVVAAGVWLMRTTASRRGNVERGVFIVGLARVPTAQRYADRWRTTRTGRSVVARSARQATDATTSRFRDRHALDRAPNSRKGPKVLRLRAADAAAHREREASDQSVAKPVHVLAPRPTILGTGDGIKKPAFPALGDI